VFFESLPLDLFMPTPVTCAPAGAAHLACRRTLLRRHSAMAIDPIRESHSVVLFV